ncbi:Lipase [Bienertia sinuspersici]
MRANKENVTCHVMLLPDKNKAKFGNLFKEFVLVGKNIPEEEHESKFIHKGMIYISIFIQIVLKHLSKPLKIFQHFLEDSLNYGVTQRDSEKYYTLLGCLDPRLDLDKTLKRGDSKYYPSLAMMASKLAYENKAVINAAITNHWKMEFLEFYNFYNEFQHKCTTQAFLCREKNSDGDVIVVAFRGTSMFVAEDWSTDFDFSWVKIDGMGKGHMGFMMALGLNKFSKNHDDYLGDFSGSWPKKMDHNPQQPLAYYTIREKLKEMIANSNKNTKFIVTGHSLGGALAILFPAILALHGEEELLNRLEAVYTFGQPRVGDAEFGHFVKDNLRKYDIKYYRIVYGYDIVPWVPLDNTMMTFKHFGRCIRFNCLYHGKIIEEEEEQDPNIIFWLIKGFILTLINFIVARVSAVYELVRGFSIGFTRGPDYREGWTLTCLRIIGIFSSSFINHFPQDYVNSTMLASKDLFKHCPKLPN